MEEDILDEFLLIGRGIGQYYFKKTNIMITQQPSRRLPSLSKYKLCNGCGAKYMFMLHWIRD